MGTKSRESIYGSSIRHSAERAAEARKPRPLSLASYPVATGRPLPGHQRSLARAERVMKGMTRGPDAVLARPLSLASYPVATGRADHGLAISAHAPA